MKEGGIYIEMYALARIQFQKLSCDHPHAGECTLCSKSVNMFKNVFGKTSLLHEMLWHFHVICLKPFVFDITILFEDS